MDAYDRYLIREATRPLMRRRLAALNAILNPCGYVAWRNRKRLLGFDIVKFQPLDWLQR
jgi:hypothetical protein